MCKETSNWLTSPQVQEWCDKQKKYQKMTAADYAAQLEELIEYAGSELPEAESYKVLAKAFNLIMSRLDVKVESKLVSVAEQNRAASEIPVDLLSKVFGS
jgi:hypothetical protein